MMCRLARYDILTMIHSSQYIELNRSMIFLGSLPHMPLLTPSDCNPQIA